MGFKFTFFNARPPPLMAMAQEITAPACYNITMKWTKTKRLHSERYRFTSFKLCVFNTFQNEGVPFSSIYLNPNKHIFLHCFLTTKKLYLSFVTSGGLTYSCALMEKLPGSMVPKHLHQSVGE